MAEPIEVRFEKAEGTCECHDKNLHDYGWRNFQDTDPLQCEFCDQEIIADHLRCTMVAGSNGITYFFRLNDTVLAKEPHLWLCAP